MKLSIMCLEHHSPPTTFLHAFMPMITYISEPIHVPGTPPPSQERTNGAVSPKAIQSELDTADGADGEMAALRAVSNVGSDADEWAR